MSLNLARSTAWEHPQTVRLFANKPPDERMVAYLSGASPASRVLDLGCAGGRNACWLARQGFDLYALDASWAMVEHTRERLRPYLGEAVLQRVLQGHMDDLGAFGCCSFDTVLAFGVLHFAQSRAEFDRTLKEITRVTKLGGRLLLSLHSPRSNLDGAVLRLTEEPSVYLRASGRKQVMLEPAQLDQWVGEWGFEPLAPTDEITTPTERGWRTTVRGQYVLTP